MNQDQVTGILRVIVPVICTALAGWGLKVFGNADVVGQLVAALTTIVALVWTIMKHTDAAKLQSAAAIDPKMQISVPDHIILHDEKVAAVVRDPLVPNVTAVNLSRNV